MFKAGEVNFAVGDTVRITNNGRDVTGKHRLDNGRIDTIGGFTKGGDMVLCERLGDGQGFRPYQARPGAPARQAKARTRPSPGGNQPGVAGGDGGRAIPGVALAGKAAGMVFTDLSREELLAAIGRADTRKSATELFMPKPKPSAASRAAKARPGVAEERRRRRSGCGRSWKRCADVPAIAAQGGGDRGTGA